MLKIITSFFNNGHERSIRAKRNIFAMLFVKGISIITGLLLVPLTINYISPSRYGIWITLSSIIAWASFFDIGFGNGLKNKFAESLANGKRELARVYVSTTYGILIMISFMLFILFYCINVFLDWSSILNSPKDLGCELSMLAIIIFTSFLFQFVLKIITTLLSAIQKPALASMLDMLIQLLVLVLVFILTNVGSGSLISLGLALGGSQIFVLLIASIWFFSRDLKAFAPSIARVKLKYAKDLMSIGIKFFIIQIVVIVLYETNNIIIIQLFGPNEVTVYNVLYKYLAIIPMMLSIVLTPFWSAFTEAYVKKDNVWMKNVLNKLRLAWFGLFLTAVIMVACSPVIYRIWLGDSVSISLGLTTGMAFYTVLNAWGSLHTQLLNGIGKLKIQLISAIIISIINIPLSLYFGKVFGLTGLIWFQSLLPLISTVWWAPIQVNRVLNNSAKGIWNA